MKDKMTTQKIKNLIRDKLQSNDVLVGKISFSGVNNGKDKVVINTATMSLEDITNVGVDNIKYILDSIELEHDICIVNKYLEF